MYHLGPKGEYNKSDPTYATDPALIFKKLLHNCDALFRDRGCQSISKKKPNFYSNILDSM